MLLEIDPHSGVPIYRQVLDQVRQHILTGRLPVGEQLVPVRDLALQLRVNPMTISKAYSLLEAEGLLERRRGIGLFVAPLEKRRRDREKLRILEDLLRKAAVTAVQMGVSEEEAAELFTELYETYNTKNEVTVK